MARWMEEHPLACALSVVGSDGGGGIVAIDLFDRCVRFFSFLGRVALKVLAMTV
jgi:hypothetical protein